MRWKLRVEQERSSVNRCGEIDNLKHMKLTCGTLQDVVLLEFTSTLRRGISGLPVPRSARFASKTTIAVLRQQHDAPADNAVALDW